MAYYDREPQLLKTLKSFEQYKDKDFVVIIVNDGPTPLPMQIFTDYDFKIYTFSTLNNQWHNSAPAYNYGLYMAAGELTDIVIIQNAECYHAGDIIGYAEKHLTDKNYISFGCYSLSQSDELPPKIMWPEGASFDGHSAWYNHPIHRAVGYHFCAAITKDNLRKLNGFDERYAYGIGYDDNDLVNRVKNLGLTIEITEDPFVFHQWHYVHGARDPFLIKKNADLFANLQGSKEYRARHLITPDL